MRAVEEKQKEQEEMEFDEEETPAFRDMLEVKDSSDEPIVDVAITVNGNANVNENLENDVVDAVRARIASIATKTDAKEEVVEPTIVVELTTLSKEGAKTGRAIADVLVTINSNLDLDDALEDEVAELVRDGIEEEKVSIEVDVTEEDELEKFEEETEDFEDDEFDEEGEEVEEEEEEDVEEPAVRSKRSTKSFLKAQLKKELKKGLKKGLHKGIETMKKKQKKRGFNQG